MKTRFSLLYVIKVASIFSFTCIILPFFAVLSLPVKVNGSSEWMLRSFWELLCCDGAAMLVGALIIPPLRRKNKTSFTILANIIGFLTAVVCAVVVLILRLKFPGCLTEGPDWYFGLAAGGSALLSFLAAGTCILIWEWDYDKILSNGYLLALAIVDIFVCLLFWLLHVKLSLTVLSLTMLFTACSYAAGRNQGNIDYLMEKRNNHSNLILPKKMRWYSFSLVSLIFLLIFGGYFLRKPISAAFSWIIHQAGAAIMAILRLFIKGNGNTVPGEDVQYNDQIKDPVLPPAESESSPFWSILGILLVIAMVSLIVIYRREIWRGIRLVCSKIWKGIKALFLKLILRGKVPESMTDSNEYYKDDVEEIIRTDENSRKKQKPYDSRRWKREYRSFKAMKDSAEKMREGYRLALMYFLLQKIPLTPADTPDEIRKKAEKLLPKDLFLCVTEGYCHVRYDDRAPEDQELRALSAVLERAAS